MPLIAREDCLLVMVDLQPRFWGDRLDSMTCGALGKLRLAGAASTLGVSAVLTFPDGSGHLFRHARWHPRGGARLVAPVGAGRHADQLGETGAEGAQRRAAHRETNLGDTEVATAQQRHRALDAPRHQVPVRRLAVGAPELPAEVPSGHVRAAGERLDIQRLRILPVDPVTNPAQPGKVAQVLRLGGSAGHLGSLSIRRAVIISQRCRPDQAELGQPLASAAAFGWERPVGYPEDERP